MEEMVRIVLLIMVIVITSPVITILSLSAVFQLLDWKRKRGKKDDNI